MDQPLAKQETPWKFLVLVASLLMAVVAGSFFYVVEVDRKSVNEGFLSDIDSQLAVTSAILTKAFSSGERHTRFLVGTPPIRGVVRASQSGGIDPLDQTPLAIWKSRLETIAVVFMENNPEVLQIRYIGVEDNGLELVRVSREFGHIRVTSKVGLQSKSDEAYFQQTLKLPAGQMYVSQINLNREHGKVYYPLMPTYRISTPVYDGEGAIFGLFIVNFDGKALLENIRNRVNQEHISLYILNHENEFIVHPLADKEFTEQLGHNHFNSALSGSFNGSLDSSLNSSLNSSQDGASNSSVSNPFTNAPVLESDQASPGLRLTIEGDPLLFSAQRVWLSRPDEGRYLDVVASVPERVVAGTVYEHLVVTMSSLGLVIVLIIIVILFYQRQISRQYELIIAEAQFKAIVNGSQDAIVSVDTNNRVTTWNRAARRLLGYDSTEALGLPLFHLLNPRDVTALNSETLKMVRESGIHKTTELTICSNDNEEIDLAVSLSPIESDDRVKGVTLILRDVSQEKRAATEIRRLNASLESQVAERTADLEIARDQALQANEMKSAFLANMSHEIRTPMNGIFGMLNLIKQGGLPPNQARYLSMAESSVETLSSLINDILDLSKVEAGKLELELVEFDLLDLISSQISSLSLKAQQKGLEVLFDFAGVEHSGVVGDPHRFKQIMTNLMGNAIKFTQRGEIMVTARTFLTSEGDVNLTYAISDTGVGIPPDKAGMLFDAFSQADTSTTRQFGGTGLGLSITRHLVSQMGGTIRVESKEGEGSTFTVNLKLPRGTSEPAIESHKPHIVGKRVMVLAKNLNLMASTRKLLRGWKAHVDTTSRIDEVLARISNRTIDILLLDQEAFLFSQNETLMNVLLQSDVLSWLKIAVLAPQIPNFEDLELDGLESTAVMKVIKPASPVEFGRMLDRFYGEGGSEALTDEERRETLEQHLDQQLSRFADARILIVDDVMINREVINGLLEGFGFSLLEAENGLEALEVLAQEQIDLVLMDCQMPQMDGYSATTKIREGAAGKQNLRTTIIAMTAGAMAGDRDACIAAGMNDYLTKPIVSFEFKQKLLHWLQSSKGFVDAAPMAHGPTVTLDEFDSAPEVNFDAALARMGNNSTIFKKMVDMYLEDTPTKLRSLSAAMENDEIDTARYLGHALKGTSATIGAERMQRLCEQIEAAAEQENVDIIREAVVRLNSAYPDLLRHLANQELA